MNKYTKINIFYAITITVLIIFAILLWPSVSHAQTVNAGASSGSDSAALSHAENNGVSLTNTFEAAKNTRSRIEAVPSTVLGGFGAGFGNNCANTQQYGGGTFWFSFAGGKPKESDECNARANAATLAQLAAGDPNKDRADRAYRAAYATACTGDAKVEQFCHDVGLIVDRPETASE